jgi:putative NADPH-quinone reductase
MSKKTLIFNANPRKESFNASLAKSYLKGAENAGFNAETVNLIDLDFDPILRYGYSGDQELEPDLKVMQEKIMAADHLVFVFPVWWGTYPALLKGFIDRTFTAGFAFKFRGDTLKWDRLLPGKTARLIMTMDTPKWYYSLGYKSPAVNSMKKCIMEFCGIKPVKTTIFSPIRKSDKQQRSQWLKEVEKLGNDLR